MTTTIIPASILNVLTKVTFDPATNILAYTDERGDVTEIPLPVGGTGTTIRSGPLSPVDRLDPLAVNELYYQVASDRVVHWLSTGVRDYDWLAVGGTAVISEFDPGEAPAYAGQIWIVVSIGSDALLREIRTYTGVDVNGPPSTTSWETI